MKALHHMWAVMASVAVFLCGCEGVQPTGGPEPFDGNYNPKQGVEYVWDGATIPNITIKVKLEQWNKFLQNYDKNHDNKEYVLCDVVFDKDGDTTVICNAGMRLRGNTSRRRPEKGDGQIHHKDYADWQHCHFGINFHKYMKDPEHELHGCRKLNLKWFKDDPMYVRELFCYDLFRKAGVWTGANDQYCRLYIHVEGDSAPAYFGVYNMIEPIDENYVKARKDKFESTKGFVWKCRYGAALNDTGATMGAEDTNGHEFTYELKTQLDSFSVAKAQLVDFIKNFNKLTGTEFENWIEQHCDVEFLLRTYAVNVALGMWDDYWNNKNNYYVYFDQTADGGYKFFFIPYDYDNTLGTCCECGVQSDAGRQNPLQWGKDSRPLIYKLLKIERYRKIYCNELLRLVDESEGLMDMESSRARIIEWHRQINKYIVNDTGEDMEIRDVPASWGNHSEYRLLETGSNNFFRVKAESIRKYCK